MDQQPPFPEPRPARRPAADGPPLPGGDHGQAQDPRRGELSASQEGPRGCGPRVGAAAGQRGEPAAGRDAQGGGRQVRGPAGPVQRHGHRPRQRRRRQQQQQPPVLRVGGRLGVPLEEAQERGQPRHARSPAPPRLRGGGGGGAGPGGVHLRRAVQAHPRGVQAGRLQALRPRRPLRPQPGGQGRVPVAQVRPEGDQGQPLPQGLLPVLLRARVPRQEEGAEERGGQDRPRGHVRGRAQPRRATAGAAAAARRQERRRREAAPGAGASPPAAAAAAAAETRNGRQRRIGRGGVGAHQAEPGGADGHDADQGPKLQGRARHRALRPDPRALADQGRKLIPTLKSSGITHFGRRLGLPIKFSCSGRLLRHCCLHLSP